MRVSKAHVGLAFAVLAGCVLAVTHAFADGRAHPTPDVAEPPLRAAPLQPAQPSAQPAAAAEGRSGDITFDGGAFSLSVPASYKFYSADEARAFMQRNGAASPNGNVLGLLAPANEDIRAPGSWGAVVSYDALGFVSGDTAGGLLDANFDNDVRTARAAQNRAFEGFAVQPVFDSAASNLTWAERTAAPGAGGKDLRYEQRLLGRSGVAGLTSIGSLDQQGAVTTAAPDLAGMVKFASGQSYADFNTASDAASSYGVPQLIIGVSDANSQLVADAASAKANMTPAGGGLSGLFPWIAIGVIMISGIAYLTLRKKPDPNLAPPSDEE